MVSLNVYSYPFDNYVYNRWLFIKGATVLHIACKYGQCEIVAWLLKQFDKDYVSQKTFYGTTSLHFACSFGSFECAKLLLEVSTECIDYKTNTGLTSLYLAIQENHLNIVLLLSDYGANFHHKTEDGMNLIHVACQNGNIDILRWLAQNKDFDMNEKDTCGATGLHYASSNGHPKLVEYLLRRRCGHFNRRLWWNAIT